jgi:hypothetical protein
VSVELATKEKGGTGKREERKGRGKMGGRETKEGKETDPFHTKKEFNISIPLNMYVIT